MNLHSPGLLSILRKLVTIVGYLIAVGLSILGLSSYLDYTTAGFDFESKNPLGVDVTYVRLRWDDGSTWMGQAVQPVGRLDRQLEWFDPGGTLWASSTRPVHRSRWNDFGFWFVAGPANDPYLASRYAGATASRWWACPSWLIISVLWIRPVWKFVARHHTSDWRRLRPELPESHQPLFNR